LCHVLRVSCFVLNGIFRILGGEKLEGGRGTTGALPCMTVYDEPFGTK